MRGMGRTALISLSAVFLLAGGFNPVNSSRTKRLLNTEITIVSFGSTNGEVAPCG